MSTPENTSKWTASPAVTTHTGRPIPPEMLFFSQPPEGIGPVISAGSTMREGKTIRRLSRMWLTLGLILAASVVLGLIVNSFLGVEPIYDGAGVLWLPVVAVVIFFMNVERLFPTTFECTFVGERGWARESIDGKSQVQETVLQFDACHELITESRHYYQGGVSKGLHYTLTWHDTTGQVGQIKGVAPSGSRRPSDDDPLHFARAAERAWTSHIAPAAQARLQADGSLVFPIKAPDLKGNFAIRLSPTGVAVRYEDTDMSLGFSEMEPVQVFHETAGTGGKPDCLMIRKKGVDRHTFGQTTVTIDCSEVANVQLLLDLLAKGIEGKT